MSLSAVLNEQQKTVQVTLHNTGHHTYLIDLGGRLGRSCSSAFQFTLRGQGVLSDRLLTSCGEASEGPSAIPGPPMESWIVFLPGGASYGMTFPLIAMRPMHHMHMTLSSMIKEDWALTVRYGGSLDENYVLEWRSLHRNAPPHSTWSKEVPFWTGTVETTISHHH